MIPETVQKFVEERGIAFVASATLQGVPHLAAGENLKVEGSDRIVFESWCCPETLRNVKGNPKVSVSVTTPDGRNGYQFLGVVEKVTDTAILDGFVPGLEVPGMPQVASRLEVRVGAILTFSVGVHTDKPM